MSLFQNVVSTDEIDLVHSSRARLWAEYQVFSRRLNSLQSPTRNIPDEILSLIFLFASPPIDITPRDIWPYRKNSMGFFCLREVCAQWFYAVQSTPQLWSSLALHVPTPSQVAPKLSLLQMFLKNVKNVPFSLEIKFHRFDLPLKAVNCQKDAYTPNVYNPEGVALLAPFYSIIFASPENSRRIRVLRMNALPQAWSRMSFKNFSILEDLRFGEDGWCGIKLRNIEDFHTPHLRRIMLEDTAFLLNPKDASYGKAVTVVNLDRLPVNDCFNLLRHSPNVVKFRAESIKRSEEKIDLPPSATFTMLKLEVFEWNHVQHVGDEALLEHVRLPALCVLYWSADGNHFQCTKYTDNFIRRLPQSCEELDLSHFSSAAIHSWHLLTSVRKLTIRGWHPEYVNKMLESLADNHLLPALREICLIGNYYDEDDDDYSEDEYEREAKTSVRNSIQEMVLSRWRNLGKEGFCIRTVAYSFHWDWKDMEWIQRLSREEGFEVEVDES